jgi:[methyl-Co(III) methanol-specific corrinoid protein]:coenzyme M methyltransferase
MFTEKERLKRAMRLETVDRPPCVCPGGMMNLVTRDIMAAAGVFTPEAHTDPALMAKLAAAANAADCFENYGLPFCMTVEVEGMGAEVNLGTVVYEPHVTGYPIETVDHWRRVKPLERDGRVKTVIDAVEILSEKKGDIPIIGNLTGPMSVASSLVEPMVFYKELRKKQEEAHAFVDFITDQLLWFGIEQLKSGADIISISDPSGTGEILGPKYFAEYAAPALNKIISGIRDRFPDAGVIVHICGEMSGVFDELAEVSCDTVSFDALVNLKEAKEKLPGKAIMGNVSTYALEFADPEKIEDLTGFCIRQGSDIIAPACGMGNASPLANVRAILRRVKAASPKQQG